MDDVQLKYPAKFASVTKSLTAPKPDVVFGACLNANVYTTEVHPDRPASVYSLDTERLESLLSVAEFSVLSCGAVGTTFCLPTFAIERKSDSGSCYLAQNQLIQTLACMLEAQRIAKRCICSSLPILALGFVNVGNWVEFWAAWPSVEEDEQVSPLTIYPSHSSLEFNPSLAYI